ncbi:MAG TPA: N-acetylglucosamine-6-phosphate deacetylase [Ktedonobacteraceae bacterium]|nr:N-acetylglucosamine-6-phosphate deacetylase [Ktedonobacteraceae bacterium]
MSEDTHDAVTRPLQVLVAEKLYAPEEIAGPLAIVLAGTTIRALWRVTDVAQARQLCAERLPGEAFEVSDLRPWRMAPGYIDLHIHGLRGHDITSGPQEDITAISRELPQFGVTSFFPTIATTGKKETSAQVSRIVRAAEQQEHEQGAEILGIRLEGPFISHAKKGAQYAPGIRRPDPVEMRELAAIGQGWVRIIDYAPEEDTSDGLLATLVQLGILPCIGHTTATYEQALHAIDGGARHSTHLFNAMPGLEHRSPGAAGALLTDQRASVEMIADGIHLHPAMLRLIFACRGARDVALITDAVPAAGLPDGEYEFINRKVQVADDSVRLADGTLAGSGLTLDRAVRNMVAFTGIDWSEAIRMASLTPAEIAGMAHRKGKVAPGMDADLVALDEQGFVCCTWSRGRLVNEHPANESKAV